MRKDIFKDGTVSVYYYIKNKNIIYADKSLIFLKEDLLFYGDLFVLNESVKSALNIPKFNKKNEQKLKIMDEGDAKEILINQITSEDFDDGEIKYHQKNELITEINNNEYEASFVFLEGVNRFTWMFKFMKNFTDYFLESDLFFIDADNGKLAINPKNNYIEKYADFVPDKFSIW